MLCRSIACAALLLASSAPTITRAQVTTDPQEARDIAVEAYEYLYPLVTMEVTRRVATNTPPGTKAGSGPEGTFQHVRTYPPADFRDVVRPNFDTLYSLAWIDLGKEPYVLSLPDTAGRYYVYPVYDMWTDAFTALGTRTSGNGKRDFILVSPGWQGQLPDGLERMEAPTRHVWIVVRTQTNGPKDYDAVHKVQDGYLITPLSRWGKTPAPAPTVAPDPNVDVKHDPLTQVNGMSGPEFFRFAAEVLKSEKPHATDWPILLRMRRIGFVPGQSFDAARASPVVQQAIQEAPKAGMAQMRQKIPTLARVTNGWQMNTDTMGVYGNYYLKRAIVAMIGLGANLPDDAVYPLNVADADGKPVSGGGKYVLHFDKAQLPPARAFWSITMYDSGGFQVANELNRFAIGDRDSLKYNADGSLDIYIQHDRPAADRVSNWLPSPASGTVGITMRLYSPRAEVLDGRWNPPPIRPVAE
jgi:hypothetical protein